MKRLIPLAVLAAVQVAHADSYCTYTTEKAKSDKILQQAPSLTVGFGRDGTVPNSTIAVGVKESIASYLKGNLTGQIGDTDCLIYRATNQLQQHATYDLGQIQANVFAKRAASDASAIQDLKDLVVKESAKVKAGTATNPQLDTIKAAIAKLALDMGNADLQRSMFSLPDDYDAQTSIRSLIQDLATLSQKQANLMRDQARKDNWDLTVSAGQASDPNRPMFSGATKTFANLQFTYSFGAPSRNRHLDNAASAYSRLAVTEDNGPVQLTLKLKSDVERGAAAVNQALNTNLTYLTSLEAQLKSITSDSPAGEAYRIQLILELVQAKVEVDTSLAQRAAFTDFIMRNFN